MSGTVPGKDETSLRRIVQAVRELFEGRSNAVGSFTLTASTTTTTVTAINCGNESKVFYSPTTANASAEIGNGTIRVSTVTNGSFTITHANNGQTDRTFSYVAIG